MAEETTLDYLTPEIQNRLKKLCIAPDVKGMHHDESFCKNAHPAYKAACEHYEEMSIHVYGTKPSALLEKVRPREDPAIRQYRIDSFEPITKSTCKKAINVGHKIFNSEGYAIHFDSNDKAQQLKKYSLEEYPRFNSVINYMANFAFKRDVADPNGVFVIQPLKLPESDKERVRPIITCYLSKDIHDISEDHALLFEKYEQDGKRMIWHYTYADLNGIYNIAIVKQNSADYTIIELGRYEHFRGKIPVWPLGGEYSDRIEGLFESFFYPAVPFWNEVIMDHSDLRGSLRMHMFPQKWEVADECEYVEDNEHCTGGFLFFEGKRPKLCPSCKGGGRKSVKGPYDTYWVNRDSLKDSNGNWSPSAPFGYENIPTEPTKILREERDMGLQRGLSALNMDVLNNMGTNQSGIAKDIDKRTELKEFLQKIADLFFEVHLPNIFDWFTWYMFQVDFSNNEEAMQKIQPTISKPTEFDVYSPSVLTEQFKGAKEAKVNPSYLSVKQAQIQNKEFQTNPELLKTLNLELLLDPLAEITRDEISMMLMNGTITKQSAIIHDNIRSFVKRALEEDKGFADKEWTDQMEKLQEYADQVIEENKISLEMPGDDVSPGA
jgi:hypothetical protein